MTVNRGVFVVARKLFDADDPFFGGEPFTNREAWQWLIAEAAWKPRRVKVGTGRGATFIEIDRGQLSHSLTFIQKAWKWSSVKRVRTFLRRLETDTRIGRASGTASDGTQSVITITKYDEYQFPVGGAEAPTGMASGTEGGTARARQGHETYKLEEKKKVSSSPEEGGFADWYAIYPRKTGRLAAEKAFRKALLGGQVGLETLMARTAAFAASWMSRPKEDRKFIPYPASWLNAGCYLDEPANAASAGAIAAPTIAAAEFSESDWQKRLAHFEEKREWADIDWGPRPGSPGCLVPPRLLIAVTSSMPLSAGSAA